MEMVQSIHPIKSKFLNLNCPINSLSYGLVGYNILKEVSKKIDVTLFPIGQIQMDEDKDQKLLQSCLDQNKSFKNLAPSLRIFHQFSMAESIGWGCRIGFPIFELDDFNEREINHMQSLDYIFVCSQWAKTIVVNKLGFKESQVEVIPLGVDRLIFNENIQPTFTKSETVFLNIGKWEIRKGHDFLLEAFNKTFSKEDNVVLVMHSECPFDKERTQQWMNYYKNSKLGDKIFFVEQRVPSQKLVASLIKSADCCVFPSRAEGWGLPLLESLSIGKPIITTNYSGQTEFVNKNNALLIDIDHFEQAFDPPWFDPDRGTVGNWAQLGSKQLDQFCGYMKNIHKIRQSQGFSMLNTSGILTAKEFSWENTCNKILENL